MDKFKITNIPSPPVTPPVVSKPKVNVENNNLEPEDTISVKLAKTVERYKREKTEGFRNQIKKLKAQALNQNNRAYAGSIGLAAFGFSTLAGLAFGPALAAAGALVGAAAGVGIGRLMTTPIKKLMGDNTPIPEKIPAGSDLKTTPMEDKSPLLSPEIQAMVDRNSDSKVTDGNKLKLLVDGVNSFPERYKMMEEAKHSINLQTLIFHDDETGWKTAELLSKKAQEGVKCRVIYDWFLTPQSKIFDYMKKNGVEVQVFNTPLDYKWHAENTKEIADFLKDGWKSFKEHLGEKNLREFPKWAKQRKLEHLKFWYGNVKAKLKRIKNNPPILLNRLNNRWHQKILSVDNQKAIVGGMNIGSDYALGGTDMLDFSKGARGSSCKWTRDTDVLVEGPALEHINKTFAENWDLIGGKNAELITSENPPAQKAAEKGGETRWIATRPLDKQGNHIENWYCDMLDNAKETAYITTAYFVPNERIMNSLCNAAKRGVDVRVLTNSQDTNNHIIVTKAGRTRYDELLEAGVRIYEKNPDPTGVLKTLHAKVAVFDGQVSTVGSHNLNSRSLYHDSESTLTVYGPEFGQEMLDLFQEDLQNSTEVTKQDLLMETPMERVEQWFFGNVVDYIL